MKLKVCFKERSGTFKLCFKDAQIITKTSEDKYTGQYEVDPTFETQTLETAKKYLSQNVIVNAIAVSEVSNPFGGKTVYIGGIF